MTSGPTAPSSRPHVSRRLGVLGWPVGHSRSPAMQNAALIAVGLTDWHYSLLPAPPELFAEVVAALPAAGFYGANVTIPHKAAALALATLPTARARAIGAANTLIFTAGGEIVADNTDAPALLDALAAADIGGVPATALVLGAGGSARAAAWALQDAGVGEVRIWNRTPERAEALAADLGARAVSEAAPADVLVNCTAVGLAGEDPFAALPLGPADLARFGTVADYVYGMGPTRLIAGARAAGARTIDGLELLVGQGALAFTRFTGCPAPVAVMRDAARAASTPRLPSAR